MKNPSVLVPPPELPRRHSRPSAELLRERALVAEPVVRGDLLNRISRPRQRLGRPLNAHAEHLILPTPGWHIGSGAMESECRVIPDRVKGPGKRWEADNAEAIMALETMCQSGPSEAYRKLAMCRGILAVPRNLPLP